MTYRNLFNLGLIISCLLGNSLAMDEQDFDYGKDFRAIGAAISDVGFVIIDLLPFHAQTQLGLTCKGWYNLFQKYPDLIAPFQAFNQVNVNLHANLEDPAGSSIFTIHSGYYYTFVPFDKAGQTQNVTDWNQTIPWRIDGNTLKVEQLPLINGRIKDFGNSHPNGITLLDRKTYKHPSLLKIQDDTFCEITPLFEGIEETKETQFGGFDFSCSTSKVVFIRWGILSCYDQNNLSKTSSLVLESKLGNRIFNFGEQFLAYDYSPKKLWLINPSLDPLAPKEIPLPSNFNLWNMVSDQDNLLVYGNVNNESDKPCSHYMISAISSENPSILPLPSFLPKGYNTVSLYLKSNYVFSLAKPMSTEQTCENGGVLVIYDWQKNQKCFQKYIPWAFNFANFVGTSLIIKTSKWIQDSNYDGDQNPDYDEDDSADFWYEDLSLIGMNLKKWLQD